VDNALMPEWGTHPANHYICRVAKTKIKIHEDELERADNPAQGGWLAAQAGQGAEPSMEDVSAW